MSEKDKLRDIARFIADKVNSYANVAHDFIDLFSTYYTSINSKFMDLLKSSGKYDEFCDLIEKTSEKRYKVLHDLPLIGRLDHFAFALDVYTVREDSYIVIHAITPEAIMISTNVLYWYHYDLGWVSTAFEKKRMFEVINLVSLINYTELGKLILNRLEKMGLKSVFTNVPKYRVGFGLTEMAKGIWGDYIYKPFNDVIKLSEFNDMIADELYKFGILDKMRSLKLYGMEVVYNTSRWCIALDVSSRVGGIRGGCSVSDYGSTHYTKSIRPVDYIMLLDYTVSSVWYLSILIPRLYNILVKGG